MYKKLFTPVFCINSRFNNSFLMSILNWAKKKTRKVSYAFTTKSKAERLVFEATSSDKWCSSNTQLLRIAQLSNDIKDYEAISKAMWKRIGDRQIQRVHKSIILLEYLIINGNERFRSDTKIKMDKLQTLMYFCHHGTGKKATLEAVVRKKAESIIILLNNDKIFEVAREKASRIRGSLVSCSYIDQTGDNVMHEGVYKNSFIESTSHTSSTTSSNDIDEYENGSNNILSPITLQQRQNSFDPFEQQLPHQDTFVQPQQQQVTTYSFTQQQQINFDLFAQPQQQQQFVSYNQQDDLLSLVNIPQQKMPSDESQQITQQQKNQNTEYEFDGLVDLNLRASTKQRDYGSASVMKRGKGQALGNFELLF